MLHMLQLDSRNQCALYDKLVLICFSSCVVINTNLKFLVIIKAGTRSTLKDPRHTFFLVCVLKSRSLVEKNGDNFILYFYFVSSDTNCKKCRLINETSRANIELFSPPVGECLLSLCLAHSHASFKTALHFGN